MRRLGAKPHLWSTGFAKLLTIWSLYSVKVMKSISKGGVLKNCKWPLIIRIPSISFNSAHDRCLACQAVQLSGIPLFHNSHRSELHTKGWRIFVCCSKISTPRSPTTCAFMHVEHSLYLEEIAVCQSPKRLGALIKVGEDWSWHGVFSLLASN
jgi:hypothetical protein